MSNKAFADKNIQFSPAELKKIGRTYAFTLFARFLYERVQDINPKLTFLNVKEFRNFKAYPRFQMEVFGPFTQVAPRSIGGALEV